MIFIFMVFLLMFWLSLLLLFRKLFMIYQSLFVGQTKNKISHLISLASEFKARIMVVRLFAKSIWLTTMFPLGSLIPLSRLSVFAWYIIYEGISFDTMKRYGDKGSPCCNPLFNWKKKLLGVHWLKQGRKGMRHYCGKGMY